MKKMKKILFVLVLVPIVLYAASRQTYSDAAGTANNLMNTGYYQNTSNQYILTTVGGDKLIDKDDYEKSKYNGRTYLSDGVEYWTKTDCSGGKYVVTASGDLECKSTGANYNTRASYYVKPNVSVTGRGTYDSPWMFEPMYKVTIMETPIDSGSLGVSEKYVPKNGTVTFEDITPAEGNRYIANDCGGTYDSSAKTFTTGRILNDTTCKLTFGTGKFQVTLNKATPRVIYVSYKDDFYSDSERTRPIREVVVEPRDGYTFKGYFYNNGVNNAIIIPVNGQNKIQRSTAGAIDKDVTLNPTYEIDSPEPSDITISGGTNVVYGHKETTLTCTNAKAYDENTDVYYEFGYKENLADATTWLANQSTNNKYYVSKATPRGTRYYTCRVQARDKVDTTIQTPWVASGSTTSMVVSNARIDFDATTNGGTLSGTTPLYAAYNDNQVYTSHMGATPGTIPVATRTGYTMNGWYTAATNGSRVIDNNRNIQSSVSNWTNSESKFLLTKHQNTAGTNKLFAQFTPNTITVKYNANGGTGGTMANTTCTYDQDCILRQNAFTRTGYTFQGWATSAGGSKVYNDKENIKNKSTGGTYNLYAVWKANEYTITFYQGNASSTAGSTQIGTQTCTYGSSCTLKTYANLGATLPYAGGTDPCNNTWSLGGWSNSQTGTSIDRANGATFTYNTAGNMKLYLVEKRVINFMGGIAPTSVQTTETQYWNPYSTSNTYLTAVRFPNALSITGWAFVGFKPGRNTANNSNLDFAASTQNTDVKVPYDTCRYLRSVYTRTITVKYNGNSSTSGSVSNQTATQYYNSGGPSNGANSGAKVSTHSFTLANNGFTRTGYTFSKWAIGSTSGTKVDPGYSYAFSPAVDASNESTIYAIWAGNKYTIKFNANSGTGTTADVTCTYGSNCTLTNNGFSRTGFAFQGWAESATGAKKYDNKATVSNLTTTNNGTVNLYAVWKDSAKPSPTVTKSNQSTSGLTATLKCTDNVGVTSYYWGTTAPSSSSTYTAITSTTSMSVDKTVSSTGTYYLSCKDAVGNEKNTSVNVSTKKQKRTRTWNSCATGSANSCVGGYDYATKVNGSTCVAYASCPRGWWSESFVTCLYESTDYYYTYSGTCRCSGVNWTVTDSKVYTNCVEYCANTGAGSFTGGALTSTKRYRCPSGWSPKYSNTSSTCYYDPPCSSYNKVCPSYYSDYGNATYCRKWNSCKTTENTCAGDWNSWSGWSDDSNCSPSSSSTSQTECRNLYN